MSSKATASGNTRYRWDAWSACAKAFSGDYTVTAPVGRVQVSHTVKGPTFNPKKHAYRNCANCGRHKNYHDKQGRCPKRQ